MHVVDDRADRVHGMRARTAIGTSARAAASTSIDEGQMRMCAERATMKR